MVTDAAADAAKLLPCLKSFVEWTIRTGPWDGYDLDGGSIQEKAVELGILTQTKYDPAIHGEDADADVGDQWFVWSDLWNTRPQPAPLEGEPEQAPLDGAGTVTIETIISQLEHHRETHRDWAQWFEDHPDDPRRQSSIGDEKFHRRVQSHYDKMLDFLRGLAARPKVEDVTHIGRVTIAGETFTRLDVLGQKYTEALRALAEREAELADVRRKLDLQIHIHEIEHAELISARQRQKEEQP